MTYLKNLNPEERGKKRAEVCFASLSKEKLQGNYEIEIVDFKQDKNVVEVFARVFQDKKQIGFGSDGTIDVERFRFFNPPLLVEDPQGDIIFDDLDINGNKKGEVRFREDPKEALRQAIEDTVRVKKEKFDDKRIVKGKIGNTTSTFYSDAGDCVIRKASSSWSTVRSASAGDSVATTTPTYVAWEKEGSNYNGYQPFHMFDTSAISSGDTISSATFSIYLNGDNAVADSQTMSICNSTQATWNSLGTGDFDQRGGSTEGCTRVSCPTGSTSGYLDFALNSTGLTFIARSGETIPGSASASGKTQLAIRWSSDLDNSTPTNRTYMQIRMENTSGTSSDPKLVVEHASAANTSNFFQFM